jgi:hypothetical protein
VPTNQNDDNIIEFNEERKRKDFQHKTLFLVFYTRIKLERDYRREKKIDD